MSTIHVDDLWSNASHDMASTSMIIDAIDPLLVFQLLASLVDILAKEVLDVFEVPFLCDCIIVATLW
jgi:hypothetical protein